MNKIKKPTQPWEREDQLYTDVRKRIIDGYMRIANASGKLVGANDKQKEAYRREIDDIVESDLYELSERIAMILDPLLSHPLNRTYVRDYQEVDYEYLFRGDE